MHDEIIKIPTKEDVVKAYSIVRQHAHRTPVLTSKLVNQALGCEVFFKCENFQRVGAFKFRGASNAVFSLSEKEAGKGV